jgi:hypothetical protein
MTKKIATPASSREASRPPPLFSMNRELMAAWKTRIDSAAIARVASTSGNRGWPSGGRTASGTTPLPGPACSPALSGTGAP